MHGDQIPHPLKDRSSEWAYFLKFKKASGYLYETSIPNCIFYLYRVKSLLEICMKFLLNMKVCSSLFIIFKVNKWTRLSFFSYNDRTEKCIRNYGTTAHMNFDDE